MAHLGGRISLFSSAEGATSNGTAGIELLFEARFFTTDFTDGTDGRRIFSYPCHP